MLSPNIQSGMKSILRDVCFQWFNGQVDDCYTKHYAQIFFHVGVSLSYYMKMLYKVTGKRSLSMKAVKRKTSVEADMDLLVVFLVFLAPTKALGK